MRHHFSSMLALALAPFFVRDTVFAAVSGSDVRVLRYEGTASTPPSVSPGPQRSLFRPSPSPLAPPSSPPSSRISWQGRSWFLMGANVAWYNRGSDFGGGVERGGVSSPPSYAALSARFQRASAAGLHVLRWWTFVGNHMETDASGSPTTISDSVYADFDAALRLADQYDLYYVFNLFRNPDDIRDWVMDPVKRAALARAVEPLFAHYRNHPRILAWEMFNEPEYAIWDNAVDYSATLDTVLQVANSIHSNSNAYATNGSAQMADVGRWMLADLDFLAPHVYWAAPGHPCALCETYAEVRTANPGIGPVVIGEWKGGPEAEDPPTDPLKRWEYWYDNGYAGAWPWSLFPEKTADGLQIDFDAAAAFTREHSDVGPHR